MHVGNFQKETIPEFMSVERHQKIKILLENGPAAASSTSPKDICSSSNPSLDFKKKKKPNMSKEGGKHLKGRDNTFIPTVVVWTAVINLFSFFFFTVYCWQ